MFNPLQPWDVVPGNEDKMKESMTDNFSLANHHSENTGNGMPPTNTNIFKQNKEELFDKLEVTYDVPRQNFMSSILKKKKGKQDEVHIQII